MNSLCTLNSMTMTKSTISQSSTSNTTYIVSLLPVSTSFKQTTNYGWEIFQLTGFTTNEIGATVSSSNVTLPAGNYIVQNYYSYTSNTGHTNDMGAALQYGTYRVVDWYSWSAWRYTPYVQAWSSMIGITLTSGMTASERQVRVMSTTGNPPTMYANGYLRVIQANTGLGTGYTANANGTFSISSGWNLQTMGSTTLSGIPGLSYSAGTFSIPPGTYVITAYYYGGGGYSQPWAYGMQTSTSAVAPTNLTNPPLDAWCYSLNSDVEASDAITRVYKFSSNNNFRMYTYAGGAIILNQAKLLFTKIAS